MKEKIFDCLRTILSPRSHDIRVEYGPNFLREQLDRFIADWKREVDDLKSRGISNVREIWPDRVINPSEEQLREILLQIIGSLPLDDSTFIGRRFPPASFIERRNPQTDGFSRTRAEYAYIPLTEEPPIETIGLGTKIPVLEIAFKLSRVEDDRLNATLEASRSRPIGILRSQPNSGHLLEDTRVDTDSALCDNVTVSFFMFGEEMVTALERGFQDPNRDISSQYSLNRATRIRFLEGLESGDSILHELLRIASKSLLTPDQISADHPTPMLD